MSLPLFCLFFIPYILLVHFLPYNPGIPFPKGEGVKREDGFLGGSRLDLWRKTCLGRNPALVLSSCDWIGWPVVKGFSEVLVMIFRKCSIIIA